MSTSIANLPLLTERQAECLAIIRHHWIEEGSSPTLRYICDKMGTSRSPEAAMGHIRPLLKKGYLRSVPSHHGGMRKPGVASPQTYVLADPEIVVEREGKWVRITLTGPSVTMAHEEWRKWLLERLKETRPSF